MQSYIVGLIANPFIFHNEVSNERSYFIAQSLSNRMYRRIIKKYIKIGYKNFECAVNKKIDLLDNKIIIS